MKVVYLAGPYTAPTREGVEANIARAREYAMALATREIGFFCPHLNSAHFDSLVPQVGYEWWIKLYLTMLGRCNAMLVMPGSETSRGVQTEIEYARARLIHIFYPQDIDDMDRVVKWLGE